MSHRKDKIRFKRRLGQEAWRRFIELNPTLAAFPGRFPTGYGKTQCILDAYDVLRERNARNRLLIVVPTDTQLGQYTTDLERKARQMGLHLTGVVEATRAERTIRYHRKNLAEIFVITVQALDASVKQRGYAGHWILDLLETGAWVGAADEYHHIGDTNEWGRAVRSLRPQVPQWIALSATPDRKQGETLFGAPVVSVRYSDALAEGGVVKDVWIKVRDYAVDIQVDGRNEPLTSTTTDLREGIKDEPISEWEARRQLRYLTKYCTPILFHGVNELNSINLSSPSDCQPQMLVYAHSCLHAKALCDIIRSIAMGSRVDWVGTGYNGRTDQDNNRIIESFKDEYGESGEVKTFHTLDILVQVNKASEGFDSKPVCVIVDLSLTGLSPQKLQQYGRGTRAYHERPLVIFVPTDSDVARYAHLRSGIFDADLDQVPNDGPHDKCDCCEICPSCGCHSEPLPTFQVMSANLIGGQDYVPNREEVIGMAPGVASLERRDLDPERNEEDYEHVERLLKSFYRKSETIHSEETQRTDWQDRVTKAGGKVAADIVRRTLKGGFEKSLLGDLCRKINGRWEFETRLSHDAMTAEDFKRKYRWLCDIQAIVLDQKQEMPRWLRM